MQHEHPFSKIFLLFLLTLKNHFGCILTAFHAYLSHDYDFAKTDQQRWFHIFTVLCNLGRFFPMKVVKKKCLL